MSVTPLLLCLTAFAPADTTGADIADSILAAFDHAWVVALGENHGHLEFHDLLIRVLEDPRAPGIIDDIAVEWGNGLYQNVIDRYMRGVEVPWDSVTMAWRNTIVSPNTVWDAPVYERFFREVRRINSGLPVDRQYRVLLADSQVDWARVDSAFQLQPFHDRAAAMARTIRRESLLKARHCLFVAGGLHVSRRPRVRYSASGVPLGEITPVAWLELRDPGSTYVIQSMGRALELGLKGLVGSGRPQLRVADADPLWDTSANAATALRNRDGSHPDVYGAAKLRDVVDAVIVWDPRDLTFPEPDPATYQVDWYWAELNRRSKMLTGKAMDASLRHPSFEPSSEHTSAN